MKWQYANDDGELIAVGMWVHVLVNCRTEGYARVIKIDPETSEALLQAAHGGRQHRAPIATLRPAALAPLMQLALEANFAPPTAEERLGFAREDAESITYHLEVLQAVLPELLQSPVWADRVTFARDRMDALRQELKEAEAAIVRLTAEVEGKTVV